LHISFLEVKFLHPPVQRSGDFLGGDTDWPLLVVASLLEPFFPRHDDHAANSWVKSGSKSTMTKQGVGREQRSGY
jgi:hypothetical protein